MLAEEGMQQAAGSSSSGPAHPGPDAIQIVGMLRTNTGCAWSFKNFNLIIESMVCTVIKHQVLVQSASVSMQ